MVFHPHREARFPKQETTRRDESTDSATYALPFRRGTCGSLRALPALKMSKLGIDGKYAWDVVFHGDTLGPCKGVGGMKEAES